MPDRQLLRLLKAATLDPAHASAIVQIVAERERSKAEEQRTIREIEVERGLKKKRGGGTGMFSKVTRLTVKKGKLLQGGKVNPR